MAWVTGAARQETLAMQAHKAKRGMQAHKAMEKMMAQKVLKGNSAKVKATSPEPGTDYMSRPGQGMRKGVRDKQ